MYTVRDIATGILVVSAFVFMFVLILLQDVMQAIRVASWFDMVVYHGMFWGLLVACVAHLGIIISERYRVKRGAVNLTMMRKREKPNTKKSFVSQEEIDEAIAKGSRMQDAT